MCLGGQELKGADLAKAMGKGARIPAGAAAEELRGLGQVRVCVRVCVCVCVCVCACV